MSKAAARKGAGFFLNQVKKMQAPKAMMESGICPATLSDFHEVNRIQQEAFTTPWSTDLIRASIVNGKYEVRVLRDNTLPIAGFYIAHRTRDKFNLDNLAVVPQLRGRGLGTQLLLHWIERARLIRCDTVSLQVNTSNVGAQKLYRAHHFKSVRLLAGYYPNGDDAFQMELEVRPPSGAAGRIDGAKPIGPS